LNSKENTSAVSYGETIVFYCYGMLYIHPLAPSPGVAWSLA